MLTFMRDGVAGWEWRVAPTPLAVALVMVIGFAGTACGSDSTRHHKDRVSGTSGTLSDDCEQLLGSQGLVSRALAYANGGVVSSDPYNNSTDEFRLETQQRLADIVFTGNKKLADPVGTLVDFLDDPSIYLRNKDLAAKVRRAANEVGRICEAPAR